MIFVIVLTEIVFYETFNNPGFKIITEISWWIHYLFISSFLFIIPRSKHLHLIFAPFNVYWRSFQTKGTLQTGILQENDRLDGVATVTDFTRKQLLDTFSCVLCGRCHRECPSDRSREQLKPKRINGFIRTYLEEEGARLKNNKPERKVAGDLFYYDFIWSCTTCHACNDSCLISIDHLSKLLDMRRGIIAEGNRVPETMEKFFTDIKEYGNPYPEEKTFTRESLVEGLSLPTISENPNAEYLLFVGCQGTFDESSRKITNALARILKEAQVDFAIMGDSEWCCGETARRMGNERFFQETVQKNISSFKQNGTKKIITLCPHCFNTFKNEYPQFGGNYEVIPHTVFLYDLWKHYKLKLPSDLDKNITYHDPCYLGRYNNIIEQPREVLKAIPGAKLVEMSKNKEKSFCCGAGGGRFWTRKKKNNPISANRVKEAIESEASLIVTSCPYCRTIFREQMQKQGREDISVLDLAELLEI